MVSRFAASGRAGTRSCGLGFVRYIVAVIHGGAVGYGKQHGWANSTGFFSVDIFRKLECMATTVRPV